MKTIIRLFFILLASAITLQVNGEFICHYAHPVRKIIGVTLTFDNQSPYTLTTGPGWWSFINANQTGLLVNKQSIPALFKPKQRFSVTLPPLYVLRKQLNCAGGIVHGTEALDIGGRNPLNYIGHGLFAYHGKPIINIWLYVYANNSGRDGRVIVRHKHRPNLLSVSKVKSSDSIYPKQLNWTDHCKFHLTQQGSDYNCMVILTG